MAKINQQGNKTAQTKQPTKKSASTSGKHSDYIYSMSMAPRINEDMHWFQLLPAAFFTAFVIMIVRLHEYKRPMNQFFWTSDGNDLTEFFSYFKMVAIVICAVLVLFFLLYRVFSQTFFIKRSPYYIPMLVYCAFVLISYMTSDYKEFALWGWNDRFEGTLPLLSYMILLFFIINTVNSENNIKWIIYPTVASSILLNLLGLSQALNHDFFKTILGRKLITPSWFWSHIDGLTFNFKNKEIYQTVYNINYVSFYLTLLIPLFGLLFIRSMMQGKEETIWKKIFWGILFALTMFNLIGSESSGGFLGMAIVVLVALAVLNKALLNWWKPIILLLAITVLIGGVTSDRWLPEISGTTHSVLGLDTKKTQEISGKAESQNSSNTSKVHIDYIETKGNDIHLSYNGNEITFTTYPKTPLAIKLTDSKGKDLDIKLIAGTDSSFSVDDKRFKSLVLGPAQDSAGNHYFIIKIGEKEWPFVTMDGQDVRYRNDLGNFVSLNKTDAIGWKNNQGFGSGRGYIWSRTLPMMEETVLIGHGADTYCIYFPQNDYVGKYNANWNLNMIVDKPHNMYMGAWIGTGGISVLALLVLWFMYVVQSFKLFWKSNISTFIEYTGLGIFLGICGFLVSGLVDDSTVSVMPMFYGLLGTGMAINIMLKGQVTPIKER
ncbi:O-antigen ligase family protein [Aminipila sp.]|uniref:O-antigen ligase family protein n=1 Tax=Aminipila sp. TaxID=2060095 RepID=UPI0028A24D33|nr:O-antigen ligase family protein [Aminipila sp.]